MEDEAGHDRSGPPSEDAEDEASRYGARQLGERVAEMEKGRGDGLEEDEGGDGGRARAFPLRGEGEGEDEEAAEEKLPGYIVEKK